MKIAVIGCGNMGLTYARSFNQYGLCQPDELTLVERSAERRAELEKENLGILTPDLGDASQSEVLVIAVKPQDFQGLCPELKTHIKQDQVLLSIMAGITVDQIEGGLSHNLVVRAMPNLPARIGMGMTAFTAKESVDRAHLRTAETLLDTTGRAIFLENESLIDAVTALSGSGPAYFFLFVDQMVKAGVEMGLDEATSRVLAKQTMLGSYHLLNNTKRSPEELIASVSSKGGTTEAAFEIFSEKNFGEILRSAIKKAEQRARDLSG